MNFLVVNDDGIRANGIKALIEELGKVGDVYVFAPMEQQSGKSHSLSLEGNLPVEKVEIPGAKLAYMVGGTPADCTHIGLEFCRRMGVEIDITFSGINMGSNLGMDTIYSGTVGAAMEAAMQGCRAVAVSVYGHNASHFKGAAGIAIQAIPYVMELPTNITVNINTPDTEPEEFKGVRYGRLGPGFYKDLFVEAMEGIYKLQGEERTLEDIDDMTLDIAYHLQGYVTITPLQFDYTHYELLEKIKEWKFNI